MRPETPNLTARADELRCARKQECLGPAFSPLRLHRLALRHEDNTSQTRFRTHGPQAAVTQANRWRGASNASTPTPHKSASRKTLTRCPYQTVCLWPAERGHRKRALQLPSQERLVLVPVAHLLTGVSHGDTLRPVGPLCSPDRKNPKPTVSAASKGGKQSGNQVRTYSRRQKFPLCQTNPKPA